VTRKGSKTGGGTHAGRHAADDGLALSIAQGMSIRKAAEKAGISERTAARRVAEPDFRKRVVALRAEMTERAVGLLTAGLAGAVAVFLELCSSTSEGIRLAAAGQLINQLYRMKETAEIEERLAALEAAVRLADEEDDGDKRGMR
jgi:hypothetical protein